MVAFIFDERNQFAVGYDKIRIRGVWLAVICELTTYVAGEAGKMRPMKITKTLKNTKIHAKCS